MAYRFPLATVLRVRELAVEQEERALTRILAEMETLRRTLARSHAELAETARARQQIYGAAALPAMHLQTSYATAQALRGQIDQLDRQLAAFEQLRVEQIARYAEAYRRREVLARLQTHGRQAWLLAESKRENKAADEAFLARHVHRKMGGV